MPISASNVMMVDPTTGKPTRVGVRFLDDGSKERFAKSKRCQSGKDRAGSHTTTPKPNNDNLNQNALNCPTAMADYKPRLQVAYEENVRDAMKEKHTGTAILIRFRKLEKITMNMGVGSAIGDKKILDLAVSRDDRDYRSETGHHRGPQIDREFSAPRRDADRLQGDAASPTDVGVS